MQTDTYDSVVLVNADDVELGTIAKEQAHRGQGMLHRAISVILINDDGCVLMQRRHQQKQLWGGYWSGSCCTHPRPGEDAHAAAVRRVQEELGITARLQFIGKLRYQASFTTDLAEHELVWMYSGVADSDPKVDPNEIVQWAWCEPEKLDRELKSNRAQSYTPWFCLQWQQFRREIVACPQD